MDINDFQEPTHEEIQTYIERNHLNRTRNWWHAREELRRLKNGPPPDGYSDWGIYFKAL